MGLVTALCMMEGPVAAVIYGPGESLVAPCLVWLEILQCGPLAT